MFRLHYRWQQEMSAASKDSSASLAVRTAKEHRAKAAALTTEAAAMDPPIKEMIDMEEKGFWLCDDGHEKVACSCASHETGVHSPDCPTPDPALCDDGKQMNFIKRSEMTGQEKYERMHYSSVSL